MTPEEREALANDPVFQVKVKQATIKAANDILAATDQPVHVMHYGQGIVTEPNGIWWISSMTYGVLTNPVIDGDSPDDAIQFTVNSIFVKYASAYYKVIDTPAVPQTD